MRKKKHAALILIHIMFLNIAIESTVTKPSSKCCYYAISG